MRCQVTWCKEARLGGHFFIYRYRASYPGLALLGFDYMAPSCSEHGFTAYMLRKLRTVLREKARDLYYEQVVELMD